MVKLLTILFIVPFLSFGQNRFAGFGQKTVALPDADSIAFVTKVVNNGGSLTATEKTAIGTLIKQFKDSSLWTSFKAIYPMVGGSSLSCKVNLKDTVNFNLTFTASPTFTSNGVDWNGTTQFANTSLTPSVTLSLNSTHTAYYSRENVAEASICIGVTDGTNNLVTYMRYTDNRFICSNNAAPASAAIVAGNLDSRGLFVNSRVSSSQVIAAQNGISTTVGSLNSVALPTAAIYIGARNGAGSASNFVSTQCAFASIGLGLTTAQIATLYNIVQAFQTTLGRQV